MASPPENIRQARVRAGLEPAEVARAVGLNKPWHYDVEAYEDEATENLRLGTLVAIARTIGTTVEEIIEGAKTEGPVAPQSMAVLADLLRARVNAAGLTADAYGNRMGWDIRPILENPEEIWEYPFTVLAALCGDLGVDWRAFIEGAPTARQPGGAELAGER